MENKNFIIAVVLSVAVMFIWSEFFAPKPQKSSTSQTTQTAPAASEKVKTPVTPATPAANPADSTSSTTLSTHVSNPEQTGMIKNDSLEFSFSSKSGKITKALIIKKKYAAKNVDLAAAVPEGSVFPEMSSVFSKEPDYLVDETTDRSVTFKYENENVIELKKITLQNDFKATLSKTIINNGTSNISWTPQLTYVSQFENKSIFSAQTRKFGIVVQKPDKSFEECTDNDDITKFIGSGSEVDWIGLNYGYFLFGVISGDEKLKAAASIDSDKNISKFSVAKNNIIIEPGKSYTADFDIYYGTKERELLLNENNGLEKTVTFGWTGFLAEPLLLALNFFFGFIGNYGLAIIFLTLVVKILLFPLSNASYKSMNKMKALQPKIKELQEKYKKDKETLNKETMLLYQKEGVNPLGGCLPMFIQMPVYIALYYMIQNAVELYNAPFLPFWLTDLSEKDPFFIIPVALGLLMFLQTKMTPQTVDNMQMKVMMYTMPVVFTWISLLLPSGMTLYWFVNTLLGIAQQMYVNKKYS
ncbi:MAG TPA: membrane protein insertase YidC [bacterium]|nr:membrane protein insertase YidC [bacterium]HPS30138.1 membrane protein insertase YidC [bacterium]